MNASVRHLVIGGGLYGLHTATALAKRHKDEQVVLIEKEREPGQRASTHNHGRLHHGYQYPLHPETAHEAHEHVAEFCSDFSEAVDKEDRSYYAIHQDSVVSSDNYEAFCQTEDLPLSAVCSEDSRLFGRAVSRAYLTPELAIDTVKLIAIEQERAREAGVEICVGCGVETISDNGVLAIRLDDGSRIGACAVYNCAYGGINSIHERSGIKQVDISSNRLALFRMRLPQEIGKVAATVLYGQFASFIPTQTPGEHILAHVEYSNLNSYAVDDHANGFSEEEAKRRFTIAIEQAIPYLPVLEDAEYKGHFTETRIVPGADPTKGNRLVGCFENFDGLQGYHVILAGKLSSVMIASDFALKAAVGSFA